MYVCGWHPCWYELLLLYRHLVPVLSGLWYILYTVCVLINPCNFCCNLEILKWDVFKSTTQSLLKWCNILCPSLMKLWSGLFDIMIWFAIGSHQGLLIPIVDLNQTSWFEPDQQDYRHCGTLSVMENMAGQWSWLTLLNVIWVWKTCHGIAAQDIWEGFSLWPNNRCEPTCYLVERSQVCDCSNSMNATEINLLDFHLAPSTFSCTI